MKKIILILLLIQNLAFGQNWSLFPIADTLCYKTSTNGYISSTIQVKPDQFNPNDFNISKSIYFCDTCSNTNTRIYKLQSDFIFENYSTDLKNKITLYNISDSAVIYTTKDVGYSWVFKDNISAVVLSIEAGTIFNNVDSIKTVLFSNGDTIKFSKSHGIYSFKHPSLGYLKLVGNHSKKLGTILLDYNKQKKVGVGDYINFKYYRFSGDYGFPCSYHESNLYKIKRIENTAWETIYHCVSYHTYSGYSFCSPPIYSSGSRLNLDDQLHVDTIIFNQLPNSLLNYGYLSWNFDTSFFNILSYGFEDNKIRINAIPNNDSTLFKKTFLRKIDSEKYQQDRFDYFDAWFETSYPYLSYDYKDFEHEEYDILSGYTIDGEIFGNIDTTLILGLKNEKQQDYKIAPNPSNGQFKVSFSKGNNENRSIYILNQLGEIVYTQDIMLQDIINVDAINLPAGVYILKIIDKDYELFERILIIKNTSQ